MQFFAGHITIIGFVNGKGRGLDKGRNVSVIQSHLTKLLRSTLNVLINCLSHRIVCWMDSPKERLQTFCCLGGSASLRDVQGSPSSSRTVRSTITLNFAYENRMDLWQMEVHSNPQCVKFFRYLAAYTPDFSHWLKRMKFLCSTMISSCQGRYSTNSGHYLHAHLALFASFIVRPIPAPIVVR